MTPDLKAMKEAAEKATPGEWRAESRYVWDGPVKGDRELIAEAESVEYAAHIAASSPANVLALIALLEEAREALAGNLRWFGESHHGERYFVWDEARTTLARIDAAMAGSEG